MNMDVATTRPLVSVLWHWQLDDRMYIPPLKPVQLIPRSSSRIGAGRLVHTHTHTHPLNGPLSGTTRVSRYQKNETNLDFTETRQ